MCRCVIKSTDLRTVFSPHAMKPQLYINLWISSLNVHFKRTMRQHDIESLSFCHVGNDRLGWQQGVCYASSKRTAAEAWVGLEPVKLQWDPTSLPTPSSLHLPAVYLFTATPPSPIFCLSVSVKAVQLTLRLGDTKWKCSYINMASRARALLNLGETLDEMCVWCFFWNSLKGRFSKWQPWVNLSHSANTQGSLDVLHSDKYLIEYLRLKDCQPSAPALRFGLHLCISRKCWNISTFNMSHW